MIRSIVEIDNMEGLDFEKSCAELLSLNDFSSIPFPGQHLSFVSYTGW